MPYALRHADDTEPRPAFSKTGAEKAGFKALAKAEVRAEAKALASGRARSRGVCCRYSGSLMSKTWVRMVSRTSGLSSRAAHLSFNTLAAIAKLWPDTCRWRESL